jgi:tetratricopeptide (TPR) repeat protein
MSSPRASFLSPVALVLAASLAAPALAQAPARAPDERTRHVRAAMERLSTGNAAGALEELRALTGADAEGPEARFYVATALRLSGDLEAAVAGFQQAAAAARAAGEPRWEARALEGIATTFERMPGRLDAARAAWMEHVRFAEAHLDVADPQVGRARVQAIDIASEQETAYVEVRRRIAEREAERAREQSEQGSRGAQGARGPRAPAR